MSPAGYNQKMKIALRKQSINYQDYLIETLKNPKEAAGYLSAALEGGDISVFLLALQNVVSAQGGVTQLAKKAHKSRPSLYKSLSENGNPHLKNTRDLLSALGMHFAVIPDGFKKYRETVVRRAV